MRPQSDRPALVTQEDIARLSHLETKEWRIVWKKAQKFEGKAELDNHLEDFADLPSTSQILEADL